MCPLWENSLAVLRALARPQSATNLLNLRFPFWQSFVSFVVLRVLCECRAAFGLIVAGGDCPGFNLWGSSKLLSLQTSKLPHKKRGRERMLAALWGKVPATCYSPTGEPRSTLADEALHFRVRDGNGCFVLSMATGKAIERFWECDVPRGGLRNLVRSV